MIQTLARLLTPAFLILFAAPQVSAQAAGNSVAVEMKTNYGLVVLELDAAQAPKSVKNFLKYVQSGHYRGTVFHRVIEGFMVQGGGLDQSLKEKKTLPPVANESANGLKNEKYTVAMARTTDPNSATCQFFINLAKNDFLNRDQAEDGYGYTVIGRVLKGQKVVDEIAKLPTQVQSNPAFPAMLMRDVPSSPVVIEEMRVMNTAAK